MPKAPKEKKVVHPKSRAAAHMMRKQSHINKVDRHQTDKATKLGLLGEKLLWFHEVLDEETICFTKEEARVLVEGYLNRFEDELEQIAIKHSIGSHRSQQHIGRKQNIEITMQQERETYDGPGIEIPDILNVKNLQTFREWTQELRYIPSIKIVRLKSEDDKKKTNKTPAESTSSTEKDKVEGSTVDESKQASDSNEISKMISD